MYPQHRPLAAACGVFYQSKYSCPTSSHKYSKILINWLKMNCLPSSGKHDIFHKGAFLRKCFVLFEFNILTLFIYYFEKSVLFLIIRNTDTSANKWVQIHKPGGLIQRWRRRGGGLNQCFVYGQLCLYNGFHFFMLATKHRKSKSR